MVMLFNETGGMFCLAEQGYGQTITQTCFYEK
ncbi:hypothetical protein EZS27_017291 [termite gut metagenome]|uniref:Uncharacterized protein n=1 Tax=termite gut metagenome TaxID=433724 RepID=A0A5J4RMN4_9ZZZZ